MRERKNADKYKRKLILEVDPEFYKDPTNGDFKIEINNEDKRTKDGHVIKKKMIKVYNENKAQRDE